MKIAGPLLSRGIPFALGGQDMNQDRSFAEITDISQGFQQDIKLVAGDRSHVFKLQGLEEHPGGEKALEALLAAFKKMEDILSGLGVAQEMLHLPLDPDHGPAGELAA